MLMFWLLAGQFPCFVVAGLFMDVNFLAAVIHGFRFCLTGFRMLMFWLLAGQLPCFVVTGFLMDMNFLAAVIDRIIRFLRDAVFAVDMNRFLTNQVILLIIAVSLVMDMFR